MSTTIGTKIKELRQSRMMSQNQLCSGVISRNMLSIIENGKAYPSIETLVYLAGRLGVSIDYLVTEKELDGIYRKQEEMPNIIHALKNEHYEICLDMCKKLMQFYIDDEIVLAAIQASYYWGKECMMQGYLRKAKCCFDYALSVCNQTIYNVNIYKSMIFDSFLYMKTISPVFDSDEANTEDIFCGRVFNDYSYYVSALIKFEDYNETNEKCESYVEYECRFSPSAGVYQSFTNGLKLIAEKHYDTAAFVLERILVEEECNDRIMQFHIFKALELCFSKLNLIDKLEEAKKDKTAIFELLLRESE